MKKKITLCMVLSTFIICAILCLTNCSNDDAPTSVFTPEALKQTTWQAQMTVYNIEDEIDYTKQSILQFSNESEGIYTRTNESDGYMWNTDFTFQVSVWECSKAGCCRYCLFFHGVSLSTGCRCCPLKCVRGASYTRL